MKITIGRKIAFAFFTLLALLSTMGVITYDGLQKNVSQLSLIEKEVVKQITAGNLRFSVTQVLLASNNYIATGDAAFIREYKKQDSLLQKYYEEFSRLNLSPAERNLLNEIRAEIDSIRFYSEKIFKISLPSSKAIDLMKKIDYDFGHSINSKTTEIFDGISRQIRASKRLADEIKERQKEAIYNLIGAGFLLSAAFIFLSINKITKPIKSLKAAADIIASGNYSVRPKVNTRDEIASLADSLTRMVESINIAHKKISDNNKLLETIFSTIPSGLMVVTEDGKITTANKKMCELINLDEPQISQQTVENALANVKISEDCREFILQKRAVKNYECRSVDFSGSEKFFELTYLPVNLDERQNLLVAKDITNYKLGQQKLLELQRLNQTTLDSLQANICVLDESGNVIILNKTWQNLKGVNSPLLKNVKEGTNYLQIIETGNSEQPAVEFIKGVKDIMAGIKNEFQMEYRSSDTSGEQWFIGRVLPMIGSESLPRKVVVSHFNNTRSKKAELALKESEERYRKLFESSPIGITIEDEDGTIVDANESMCKISGYSKEELIGSNARIFAKSQNICEVEENIGKLLSGSSLEFEIETRKKDGGTFLNQLFLTSILLHNGRRQIISLSNDITEKRKTERYNKELAEKYLTLLETTSDGFWVVDKAGRIIDVNDNYCRMSGYSRDELLKLTIPDLEAKETPEETARHIQKVIKKGSDRFETKHKRKDGSVWDVEISTVYWANKEQFIVFAHDISERKRDEAEKIKLTTAVEQSADVVFITDKNGVIEYVNPSFEKLTGYGKEEAIGQKPSILKSGKQDDNYYKKLWGTITAGQVFRSEPINRKKNGEFYYSSQTITPIKDNNGVITHFLSNCRDITERKLTEQKILKFTRVVEHSPLAIMITDKEGIIEYTNSHFNSLFGYLEKDELIGLTPRILKSGNTEQHIYDEMQNVLDNGLYWKGVIQNKRKDGSLLWLNASISPIKDQQDNIISYAAIYSDITENVALLNELRNYKEHLEEMVQKRTKELEESRETFRALAENSQDVIMRFNSNLQYLYINPAIEKLAGMKPEEFIGKTHSELGLPKHLADLLDNAIKTVFETRHNYRTEIQLPNGLWIDWFLFPEFDSDGNVKTVITSSRDITKLKKLQLEIEESLRAEKELNEQKDAFISMVSHEFRTPLASILSSAAILELAGDKIEPWRKDKHLQRIKSNVDNLTSMLEEVVFINKFDLGKVPSQKERIDLRKFCSEVIEEHKEIYPSLKSELIYETKKRYFDIDALAFKKILGNLVSNAFKYNSRDGKVQLTVKTKSNYLIFKVSDTGFGINADDQKNIFEAFFRAPNVQNIEGTGLGLHIVNKIVKQLNGRITFKSELNKGTEFTVIIPYN